MVVDMRTFKALVAACVDAMGHKRAEIDAMNVYPVADSDTGTNVYFTVLAGHTRLAELDENLEYRDMLDAFSEAVLYGARGNSGVILSQLVRAGLLAREINGSAHNLAEAMTIAAEAAYAAVGAPQEGTILTVARKAAEGARNAAESGADLLETWAAAHEAGREALIHTPEQLERLARAGVVDAGGLALVVILDTVERFFTGRVDVIDTPPAAIPVTLGGDDLVEGGPAYEVMYLLRAESVDQLRETLATLGDSLVVVGGDGLFNVHVHVDDVGAAIEAGIAAGEPFRIRVTHFADQIAKQPSGRAVIMATTGSGLSALCQKAGATTLEFSTSHPLKATDVTSALESVNAGEVIMVPNNSRYIALFEAAANVFRESGTRVAVIPTHAQVQGLAALAVHDSNRSFDEDVVAMSSAAAHVNHGAITIATRPGMTMAGPCEAGDVLGAVNGDFAFVGKDQTEIALGVADRLLSGPSELVSIVTGDGCDDVVVRALEDHIRLNRPDIDVEVYEGGQENYSLFIAVE